jgi:hypothetical protein
MNKKIKLKVSAELYNKIKKLSEGSGFSTVEEYLLSLIEDKLKDDNNKYNKEEEEEIKQRLKSLGYIE